MLAGAANDTVALPNPGVATPIVGALGAVAGITLFEAADGTLDPIIFVATTVNV